MSGLPETTVPEDTIPRKKVDFSPRFYLQLLRNLKKIYSNITYDMYKYDLKQAGLSDQEIEDLRPEFNELRSQVQTKIDLLQERLTNLQTSIAKGELDYDYTITCSSVKDDFSLEKHLEHLKPNVVFKRLLEDANEVRSKRRVR